MGRPKTETGETPKRNVRVPDDVWYPAKARAKSEYTKVSTIVVTALRQYAANGTIPLSDPIRSHLLAHAGADAAGQRGQASLRTFVADGETVLLDSAEVSALLRAMGGAEVADQLDRQCRAALDGE